GPTSHTVIPTRASVVEIQYDPRVPRRKEARTNDCARCLLGLPDLTPALLLWGRSAFPSLAKELRLPQYDLSELGWSPDLAKHVDPGLTPGRVAPAHRGASDVWTADGAVRSRLPGRAMHDGVDVAVGDWVGLSDGLIRTVLPRRSAIIRNAAGFTTTAQ